MMKKQTIKSIYKYGFIQKFFLFAVFSMISLSAGDTSRIPIVDVLPIDDQLYLGITIQNVLPNATLVGSESENAPEMQIIAAIPQAPTERINTLITNGDDQTQNCSCCFPIDIESQCCSVYWPNSILSRGLRRIALSYTYFSLTPLCAFLSNQSKGAGLASAYLNSAAIIGCVLEPKIQNLGALGHFIVYSAFFNQSNIDDTQLGWIRTPSLIFYNLFGISLKILATVSAWAYVCNYESKNAAFYRQVNIGATLASGILYALTANFVGYLEAYCASLSQSSARR